MNEENHSKFVTRRWHIVNDQSNANYDVGNAEILKSNLENYDVSNTEVLKSNLCDYNGTYVLVKGNITIIGHQVTQVAIKFMHNLLNVSQKLMEEQ